MKFHLRRLVPWAALSLLFAVYGICSTGLVCSNDRSHYALVKALAEEHRLKINSYVSLTGFVDVAVYEDDYYTDRAPATAFFSVPLYFAGKLSQSLFPAESEDEPIPASERRLRSFTLLFPLLTGTLSVLLVCMVCRQLGRSTRSTVLTGLIFAFCSANWKYSTVLFEHSLATFWLLLATCLCFSITIDNRRDIWRFLILGLLLGLSALTSYVNLILILPLLLYLSSKAAGGEMPQPARRWLVPVLSGYAVPLLGLAVYNYICFDNPLTPSYRYHYTAPFYKEFTTAFMGPLWTGVRSLLFGIGDRGMITYAPVTLFSLWGFFYFLKRFRQEALFFAFCFGIIFLLIAQHLTFSGGGTRDTRLLLDVTPYVLIPTSFWIDEFSGSRKLWLVRPIQCVFFLALATSIVLQLFALAQFPGHDFTGNFNTIINVHGLRSLLTAAFPAYGSFPLYLLAGLVIVPPTSYLLQRLTGYSLST